MKRGYVIEIIYQSKRGVFSKRYIRVIECGETYIKAYCSRRKIRMYKRDGILVSVRINTHPLPQ